MAGVRVSRPEPRRVEEQQNKSLAKMGFLSLRAISALETVAAFSSSTQIACIAWAETREASLPAS